MFELLEAKLSELLEAKHHTGHSIGGGKTMTTDTVFYMSAITHTTHSQMSIFISKSEGPKSRVFKNKILFKNKSLKVTL